MSDLITEEEALDYKHELREEYARLRDELDDYADFYDDEDYYPYDLEEC